MAILSQLRRIAAKPPRELFARAAAFGFEHIERRRFRRGTLAPPDRLERSLGPGRLDARALLEGRRSGAVRFLPSVSERDGIRDVVVSRFPDELADTRRWAERAQRHEFEFFGRVHAYGADIPWQADPVSRRSWPSVFWADALGPNSERDSGDVKDVCELNRQLFLVDLAKAHFLDDRPDCAQTIRRLVGSWLQGNPYATGINWASPLEPAYRTFSWLWAYYLTLDDPAFAPEEHADWLRGFLDSGRFLHGHLELYASPYNHLIGEATALYLLGTLFPEFAEASAWRTRGRAILHERLADQFHADGGTVEQATLYHHATLGFYLLAGLVGRANGDDFAPAVWQAIERAIEFSMLLVQPDGQLPAIGDTDDARPIQLERKPFFDFRAYQAIGAVLFERPDFKAVAARFHEDALWVLGLEGLRRFDALPDQAPSRRSVALRESGYFVSRSDWTPDADYVCFDCGAQAGGLRHGDVPSAAHGHADCLSVIVHLAGQPVLVDSGFYTYNGDVAWERHFRETGAHNTARVDGLDQARHHAKMAWSHAPRVRVEHDALLEEGLVIGSHDGFVAAAGVRHRRTVRYRREGRYVVVCDEFDGPGEHDIDVFFHFAPRAVTVRDEQVAVGDVATLRCVASFPTQMTTIPGGGPEPDDGWVATSLGVRVPAPVMRVSGRMRQTGAALLTVVLPADCAAVDAQSADGMLAVSVTGSGWRDLVTVVPPSVDRQSQEGSGLRIVRQQDDGSSARYAAALELTEGPVR